MRKIAEGIYTHRGYDIIKDEQGIYVSGQIYLFQTFTDAKEWINLRLDGTHKSVPRIVGEWREENMKKD